MGFDASKINDDTADIPNTKDCSLIDWNANPAVGQRLRSLTCTINQSTDEYREALEKEPLKFDIWANLNAYRPAFKADC